MSARVLVRPTRRQWQLAASQEAQEAGVCQTALMAGVRTRPLVLARWRAWKRLRDARCSYSAIGALTGFDHTSVRYGILRLSRAIPKNTKAGGVRVLID